MGEAAAVAALAAAGAEVAAHFAATEAALATRVGVGILWERTETKETGLKKIVGRKVLGG